MSRPNDRPAGNLLRVGQAVPTVEVDCSGWARAEGPRSRGKLVNVAQHLTPVTRGFVRESAVWLELLVSFDVHTPAAKVFEHANRLIATAAKAVPELGLTYDIERSRTENDNVVIALKPMNLPGAEQRLNEVVAVFRQETSQFPGVRQLVATVAHVA